MQSNLEKKVGDGKIEETNINEEISELKDSIESLEHQIRTTNSNKKVSWRGILGGFSGAVGATIVFGIVIALVSGILYRTHMFPELNEFLKTVTTRN